MVDPATPPASPAPRTEPADLDTLQARLRAAVDLHRRGEVAAAEQVYLNVLEALPDQPDALHFLGLARHHQGRDDEAVELLRRAVTAAPEYVHAWNNLGNVLRLTDHLDEAAAAYQRALLLDDHHAGAWSNLATILAAGKRFPEALAAHRRAIELAPDMADAYYGYANTLRENGDLTEAIAAYRKTIGLNPGHQRANTRFGYMLYLVGRHEDAADVFRDWLSAEPDNPVARHMLAACTGAGVPERASDDFIRSTFDGLAAQFDELLLNKLAYRAPQLVADAVGEVVPPLQELDVLDAGCGTGLCATLLRPFARTLTGVDLSQGMIAKSLARGGYDGLHQAELTAFLRERPLSYDLVVSADTLVYFGELRDVSQAAATGLRPGGWFVFTVEALEEPGTYVLGPHGRYLHAAEYVVTELQLAGFDDVLVRSVIPRVEAGLDVRGLLVRGRKGADDQAKPRWQ